MAHVEQTAGENEPVAHGVGPVQYDRASAVRAGLSQLGAIARSDAATPVGYALMMGAGFALSFGQNLVLPIVLTPTAYGYYAVALASAAYFMPLQLGLLSGMNRELPIRFGRDDQAEVSALVGGATTVLVSFAVIALIATAAVLARFHDGDSMTRFAIWMGGAIAATANLAHIVVLRLRAAQRVWAFASLLLVQRLTTLALVTVACVVWGVVGLLVAVVGIQFVVFWSTSRWCLPPVRYRPVRWRSIGVLMRTGIPLMVASAINGAVFAMDRVYLANTVTVDRLGFYQFATLPLMGGVAVSSLINQYLNPRLLFGFGRDGSIRRVYRLSLTTSICVLAAFLVAWPVAMPVLEFVVRAWMPTYVEGLPLMRVFYFGGMFAAAGSVGVTVTAANRQGFHVVTSIVVGVLCLIAYTALVRLGASVIWYAYVAISALAIHLVLSAGFGLVCTWLSHPLRPR